MTRQHISSLSLRIATIRNTEKGIGHEKSIDYRLQRAAWTSFE